MERVFLNFARLLGSSTLLFFTLSLASVSTAAAASVTGRVTVSGIIPKPRPLQVFKSRAFCGPTVPNETLLIGKHGGLQNAVLQLWPKNAAALVRPVTISLDNQRCAFTPHVQVAPLGSELLLKNSDPILHTVHARLGKDTLFNVGLPRWRQVTKRLDQLGAMRIDCDVLHTWMSAVIVVTATPYFAVSDENGEFRIDGLPGGEYKLQVWHERLGEQTAWINIAESQPNTLESIFSLPARR